MSLVDIIALVLRSPRCGRLEGFECIPKQLNVCARFLRDAAAQLLRTSAKISNQLWWVGS